MSNVLGVEIEREFGIKYAKNRMEDAITFVAHKRTVNLPAMYMKSLSYDGKEYIKKLLLKYLETENTALNFWIMKHVLVDRKSTRLNSSHANISYAVFCL